MDVNELALPEQKQMLDMLDELRKMVLEGELISILAVAEMTSGQMYGSATSAQNVFAVAGYIQYWAMNRMGFNTTEKRT